MGSWSRIHRAPVEFDRVRMVGRLSGGDRDAAECRLDRDLRAQLPDGPCRLVTGAFRDGIASPDFAWPASGADNWHRSVDPCAGLVGSNPTANHTDREHGDLATNRSAVGSSDDEMGPDRGGTQLP